jgi:hypothetical protein
MGKGGPAAVLFELAQVRIKEANAIERYPVSCGCLFLLVGGPKRSARYAVQKNQIAAALADRGPGKSLTDFSPLRDGVKALSTFQDT